MDSTVPEPCSTTTAATDIFVSVLRQLTPRDQTPSIQLRFRPYAGLRSNVRYDRVSGCIRASLSDILRDAPFAVTEAVATILLTKLYGRRVPRRARTLYRRWVNAPVTQEKMLVARRTRGRKQLLPPRGQTHDLDTLFDRLNRRHFDAKLRKPALGWSPQAARRTMGHYDPAHDAIAINRALDNPAVPRLAVEYVLFHEMLHVKHPVQIRNSRRRVHTPEFLAEERRFPGYEEARRILESL